MHPNLIRRRTLVSPRVRPSGDGEPPAPFVAVPREGFRERELRPFEIAMFQQILAAMGANDGGRMRPDGELGPRTRAALTEFQRWWDPAALARPNADVGDAGLRGGRTRYQEALASVGGRVAVDGVLGPVSQRLLIWLAMPVSRGGGGEALDYASVPVVGGVRPARIVLVGDAPRPERYILRAPPTGTDFGLPTSLPSVAVGAAQVIGRRTIEVSGLDPARGARIFVEGRDVTTLGPEDGSRARWVAAGTWRAGIPEAAQAIRVVLGEGGALDVAIPAPPDGSEGNMVARSVRVLIPPRPAPAPGSDPAAPPPPPSQPATVVAGTVPADPPPVTPETPPVTPETPGVPPPPPVVPGTPGPPPPPPAPTTPAAQAGMGGGVLVLGALGAVAAVALALASRKR